MNRKQIAALFLLNCMMISPAFSEGTKVIVTSTKATVYSDQTLTQKIGSLSSATVLTMDESNDESAYVTLNGHHGYMAQSDLKAISDIATASSFSRASRVYKKASTKSASVAVAKGTKVNVLAVNGQWAMIEKDGIVGYTNKAHVGFADSERESETEITQMKVTAAVTPEKMGVYKSASTSSKKLGTLKKGTVVTVVATRGEWAAITLSGKNGYCRTADLERTDSKPEQEEQPAQTENYLTSDKYSVEQKCYLFLTKEMGFNTAAACGVLSNIERECDFNPHDASYDGGYGLIQWTGSRNTKLKNWCKNNGYDYTTVEGQMWYLKYELEHDYPSTLSYMKKVENTASGAYDAAYYWCYYFEIPASKARRSVERGNIAKDTYWKRYAV